VITLTAFALQWNRRRMRLPYGARCRCGVGNPLVLIPRKRRTICYRCNLKARARSGLEEHHIGGRPSPLHPVPVDANVHRVLSDLQQTTWRRSPHISPGSPGAVVFDLVALMMLLPRWTKSRDR
jgi:hypothetical protein